MPAATHYEILGISLSATTDEIRDAIRAERRRWTQLQGHPNLERRQEAENRINQIAAAESVLLNAEAKAAYDRTVRPPERVPDPPVPPERTVPAPPERASPSGGGRNATSSRQPVNLLVAWVSKNRGTAIAAGAVALAAIVISTSVAANAPRPSPVNAGEQPAITATSPTVQSSSPLASGAATPSPTPTPTLRMNSGGEFSNGALYSGTDPFFVPGGSVDRTRILAASGPHAESIRDNAIFMESKTQRLVSLVEYRTPAVDLTPASVELRLNFYNTDRTAVSKAVKVLSVAGTSYSGPIFDLIGSSTKNVILTRGSGFTGSSEEARSTAYDGLTGQELWSRPGTVQRTVAGVAVNYLVTEADNRQCYQFEGINLDSGAALWALDGSDLDPSSPCGYASPSNQFWPERYVAIDGSGTNMVIDGVSGARMNWPDPRSVTVVADPVSGQAFANYEDDEPAYVFDPRTGQRGFSVPAAQAAALDLHVMAFFDGKLYAQNTTEKLVISATTGETISRGWTAYPLAVSGGLVLYNDGSFRSQTS